MNDKLTYKYLVHLVSCTLRGESPAEPPKGVSLQKVMAYGKFHEVANIAFLSASQLCHKRNPELHAKWKTLHALSLQRHANQMAARETIVDALSTAGIRHLEVQGTIMKTLYPQPHWRMMSDIDFIVDLENLTKAEGVLQAIGYRTECHNGLEINAYGNHGIAVELHTDFFAPTSVCYGTIRDPFSYAEPAEGYSHKGSNTIFYLYNLLHTIKHYLQRGAGIRRIMDLFILRTHVWPKVDQAYVQKVLADSGYADTAETLLAVAEKWFGCEAVQEAVSEAEELVWAAGNHGTYQVSLINEYKNTDTQKKRFYKLRKFRALLFPPKEGIYKSYPQCRRLKLPVFLCWIYRWVYLLFHRKRRKDGLAMLSDISKTTLK